jgi:hypothetical protein
VLKGAHVALDAYIRRKNYLSFHFKLEREEIYVEGRK